MPEWSIATMTITLIFLILALICFVVAACGVPSRINLVAAGLALMVIAELAGSLA